RPQRRGAVPRAGLRARAVRRHCRGPLPRAGLSALRARVARALLRDAPSGALALEYRLRARRLDGERLPARPGRHAPRRPAARRAPRVALARRGRYHPRDPPHPRRAAGPQHAPPHSSTPPATRPHPLQNHPSTAREPIAASDDGTPVTPPWPRTTMLRATTPSEPLDSGPLRVQPGGSCPTH